MEFQALLKYIFNKYGLQLQPGDHPEDPYVLRSQRDGSLLALLGKFGKDQETVTFDFKCRNYQLVLRQLKGYASHFEVGRDNWIRLKFSTLDNKIARAILDYAFRIILNQGRAQAGGSQFIFLPDSQDGTEYQSQAIPPRSQNPRFQGNRPGTGQPASNLDLGAALQKKQPKPQVPAAIEKMMRSYDYSVLPVLARNKNFYRQGKMMADYEDDFQPVFRFKHYYPVYHVMTVGQLRTYFTWRTKVRQGKYDEVSPSYAYLYIYELLNNIGCKNAADGYDRLRAFYQNYARPYDEKMVDYMTAWLQDYVLYYHLDDRLAEVFQAEMAEDSFYHKLLHPEETAPADLGKVFQELTSYYDSCLLHKKQPEKFNQLLKAVWQETAAVGREKGEKKFFSQKIARRSLKRRNFFAGAVFYQPDQLPERMVELDAERAFYCLGNKYSWRGFVPLIRQKTELNTFLHEVDRLVRQLYHLGRPLKPRALEKDYTDAIVRGIKNFQAQEEEARKPKVEINLQSLDQIRQDASVTRDSLLTEEEKQEEQAEKKQGPEEKSEPEEGPADLRKPLPDQPAPEESQPVPKEPVGQNGSDEISAPEDTGGGDSSKLLAPAEEFFVRALLENKPWKDYLRQHHLMASILADQINDKLFDEIGDTVIEFNEDNQPEIVPDYKEDLKEIL